MRSKRAGQLGARRGRSPLSSCGWRRSEGAQGPMAGLLAPRVQLAAKTAQGCLCLRRTGEPRDSRRRGSCCCGGGEAGRGGVARSARGRPLLGEPRPEARSQRRVQPALPRQPRSRLAEVGGGVAGQVLPWPWMAIWTWRTRSAKTMVDAHQGDPGPADQESIARKHDRYSSGPGSAVLLRVCRSR
jgi:hypothetical protein